jgi:hypothetical protein
MRGADGQKKPISIKIALGLSILIMWSNCFGLVKLLWSFPPLLKHNIPTILIAKLVVDGVINIAAIALVLTVWR